MSDNIVRIYTDGGCSGNPGPGGWGAVLEYGEKRKELCGGHPETTNNRMELTAVISGLKALKRPCKVVLTTDSKYVVDAITQGWAKKWRAQGWMRNKKDKALNPDLWQALLEQLEIHDVT
ncbi:MAG: ribonuclease HI, partial [Oscillospiraceae bacterium]